jgi:ribonuclease P protein component
MVDHRFFGWHHRLHHSWEYKRFFQKSDVFRLSECVVFRIQNEVAHYRLGITLKAKGMSVHRNQTKRKIREFFRTHQSALGSFDYNVVIPGSKKLTPPYASRLEQSLNRILTHPPSHT